VLGKFGIKAQTYGRGCNAVFFRKEMPSQDDLIERAKEIYLPLGANWGEQKKAFMFPNGARVRFRPLDSIQDAEKYQGQNISDAAIEEAGNYSDPAPIWRMFGCLRSKTGVPTQMILTFNPGGSGHGWLKKMMIDPAPLGSVGLTRKLSNGAEFRYCFIKSLITNNRILLENDPEYINRLHMVGSPELVRAWLEGDFEIHEGSYFPEFGVRHLLQPFAIPKHWSRYLGFDWGYHSPFCAVWAAVSSGKDDRGREVPYPKGSLIVYREYTGKGLDNGEIARNVKLFSEGEDPLMVADPSIFNHAGGPSIGDQFRNEGVSFRPADNERISGWNEIRRRLLPEKPMIYFFTTCKYLIQSLPALPIDLKHPEDCDTSADDHGPDALRYLCKARPLETPYKTVEPIGTMGSIAVNDYIERARKRRKIQKV
jgi:hypothetical protein